MLSDGGGAGPCLRSAGKRDRPDGGGAAEAGLLCRRAGGGLPICFPKWTGAHLIKIRGRGSPKQSKPAGPLRIQLGIDPPAATSISPQHPCFANCGVPGRRHTAVLIIAFSPPRIGDPAQRAPPGAAGADAVDANAATYLAHWARASRGARPVGIPDPRPAGGTPQQRMARGRSGKVISCGHRHGGQILLAKGSPNRTAPARRSAAQSYPTRCCRATPVRWRSDLELGRYRPEIQVAMAAICSAHFGHDPSSGVAPILPGLDGGRR